MIDKYTKKRLERVKDDLQSIINDCSEISDISVYVDIGTREVIITYETKV